MAWSKNGTTTLSSAGDTVTVSSLTASEFGVILQSNFNSGSINCTTRLNSDSGSNYSSRWSLDGASDSTFTSQASILQTTGTDTPNFALSYIINISSEEKLMIGNLIKQNTTGASTAPSRSEFVGKWANTSNSISTISTENTSTGDYDTGSNLTALNGDTTESLVLGNIQSGSRMEVTDTRKIYYWNGSTFTEEA